MKNKVPINIHLINAQIFIVQCSKLSTKKSLKEEERLKLDIEETNSLYQLADEKDRKMISNYTYQIRKPRDFYIQF